MPRMLAVLLVVVTLAMLVPVQAPAQAQDYPAKTVRVIIPLGPGGGGDIFARALADELQKRLGRSFVVENRTGGGLNIGTRACAESPPDGYTICVISNEPIVYNRFLFKSLPFNPEKDFEPITNLFFNTLAFAVNPELKVHDHPRADGAREDAAVELQHVLVSARILHGQAEEAAWRRHRARALPQRQRDDDSAPVRRNAGHAAGTCQHGPATAERSCARACGQRQRALAAVSIGADASRRRPARRCRNPGSGCSRRPARPSRSSTSLPPKSRRSRPSPTFHRKVYIDRAVERAVDTPEAFARFILEDRATAARIVKESGVQPE